MSSTQKISVTLVIAAWIAHEGSQRQLAERLKVSLSFVRNLVHPYHTSGQVAASRRRGYLRPTINYEYL